MKLNPKEIEKNYINKLKDETVEGLGPKVEINKDFNYKFRIVGRGEQLFYQDKERGLLIQINPYDYIIFSDSISKWDNGKKVSIEEKEQILERIKKYFSHFHNTDIRIV